MASENVVHLYMWSGQAGHAHQLIANRLPGATIRQVGSRQLRDGAFAGRLRLLRSLHGRALIFYFASLGHLRHQRLIECLQLVHGCRETALCDGAGEWRTVRTTGLLRSLPAFLLSLVRDAATLAGWWIYLHVRMPGFEPVEGDLLPRTATPLVYLMPTSAPPGSGGAMSHIRGFLSGLRQWGQACRVFTGTPLAQQTYDEELISAVPDAPFFWQAAALRYNLRFAAGVAEQLGGMRPGALYQRHTRFSIAGALLARRLNVPLILEYNGPELWMANHWDPSPFRCLIDLCENASLRAATRIVVVSEALKANLLERGLAAERILVNPNAVDADFFCPGPGRNTGRGELGIRPEEVLVAFAGSFSLWHGVHVLEQAIALLMSSATPFRLRFLLLGEGLLQGEMRSALSALEQDGSVIFTGVVSPAQVVRYLDAADILVSPHVPMPDGSRFFGSPTKIFEYMAMGKAIIASRLEQLAEVLTHGKTAWLVTPGDATELAQAIVELAGDTTTREALGREARRVAIERHSWRQNATAALTQGTQPLLALAVERSASQGARA